MVWYNCVEINKYTNWKNVTEFTIKIMSTRFYTVGRMLCKARTILTYKGKNPKDIFLVFIDCYQIYSSVIFQCFQYFISAYFFFTLRKKACIFFPYYVQHLYNMFSKRYCCSVFPFVRTKAFVFVIFSIMKKKMMSHSLLTFKKHAWKHISWKKINICS